MKPRKFSFVMQVTTHTHTLYKNFMENVKATECITQSKARHQEIKSLLPSPICCGLHTDSQSRKDTITPGN
jgi:hypothetical protein